VFIDAVVHITKLFAWGEGNRGGLVLRETSERLSRAKACVDLSPSRTSERRVEGAGLCERGRGRRRGAREGVYTGAATMTQPLALRRA